jgi:hypothetical protein
VSLRGDAETLLLGREERLAVRLSAAAGGIFALVAVAHLVAITALGDSVPVGELLPFVGAAAFVAAGVGAYLNGGVVVSIALAAGPALGFLLPLSIYGVVPPRTPILQALAVGAGLAVALGVAGYLAGVSARVLARQVAGSR